MASHKLQIMIYDKPFKITPNRQTSRRRQIDIFQVNILSVWRLSFYLLRNFKALALYEERQIFCKPILVLSLSGVYDDVNDHHFLLSNARVTPLNSEYFQGRHSLSLMTQILHFMYSALQFIYALDVTQPCIIFRNKPDYPSFLQCLHAMYTISYTMHQSLSGSSLLLDKFCFLSGQWKRSYLDIIRCIWLFRRHFNSLYHLYQIAKNVLWAWGLRSYRILCRRLISASPSRFFQYFPGFPNIFLILPFFRDLWANVTFNLFMGGLEIAFVKARGALII